MKKELHNIFETHLRKFVKYTVGGALTLSLKFGLTALFTEIFSVVYTISYGITLVLVLFFGFFFNRKVTFKHSEERTKTFSLYVTSIVLFSLVDYLLVYTLTELGGLHYLLSIFIVTVIIFFAKYVVFDKLIFRKR